MIAWKVAIVAPDARGSGTRSTWVRTARRTGRQVTSGRTAVVLGVPIDDVTLGEAVDRIAAMVEAARATGRVHQVGTVNADFVVNAFARPRRCWRSSNAPTSRSPTACRRLGVAAARARRSASARPASICSRRSPTGRPQRGSSHRPLRRRTRRRRAGGRDLSGAPPGARGHRRRGADGRADGTMDAASARSRSARSSPTSCASPSATRSRSVGSPATAQRSAHRCSSVSAGASTS